jgi:hypothetical protein
MIVELQTKIIDLLKAHQGNTPFVEDEAQIKPYGGELKNPKNVNYVPAVFVDTISSGHIKTEDSLGELFDGTFTPEIILFANNAESGGARRDSIAAGLDWILDALKGQFIEVSGVQVKVAEEIQFATLTDFFKPVAIVRPTITILEG